MKKFLLSFMIFALVGLFAQNTMAQTGVKGVIKDADSKETLIGATVIVKGSTSGTVSDINGKFDFAVEAGKHQLKFSYVGYETKFVSVEVTKGKKTDLGNVFLSMDAEELGTIVIQGIMDIAKDRETPVAVSTLKAAEIQEQLGTKELPEVLNYTPSVYATKQGGGFGDSRINIRGFDQRNTAIMINGMPVNDMENGWVYWSNWAGLSDVTSLMQVQRGLGSSKLAISSVGGTINVITNPAQKKMGGTLAATYGSDNYTKFTGSYNTGLLDNGFSASVLFSRHSGDGYVDGTAGQGYSWFFNLGYQINDKHSLMLTATGAPQWHHQRDYSNPISTSMKYNSDTTQPNIKYNSDWGYLNGKEYSWRRNFYHKPITSLNWDWKITDNSTLSTVVYGSWGRGGGSGAIGYINGSAQYYSKFLDENGVTKFDDIVAWNSGDSVAAFGNSRSKDEDGYYTNDRSNGFTRRASMNSHDWYGAITNFNTQLNENLSFDIGLDARTYTGYHYRIVNDALGADRYFDNRDLNNPDRIITEDAYEEVNPSYNPFIDILGQQKIEYFNVGNVQWLGGFGQLEYKVDDFSTFVQGGYSVQQFQRVDYFNLPRDVDGDGVEEPQESDWVSLTGGNIKGGANYNLNENMNIFVNAGYYSKQPLFDAVFPSYNDNTINEDLTNEKIIGFEAGYGYRSDDFFLNLNAYYTSWNDRFAETSDVFDVPQGDSTVEVRGYARLLGIKEIHTGIELEGQYRIGNLLRFDGMFSIGDWRYADNVIAPFVDENDEEIPDATHTLYLDGVKVGDAAQLTSRLGVTFMPIQGLSLHANYFYADNLYASFNATSMNTEDHEGALKLPGFGLVDASAAYKFSIKGVGNAVARFTVNNALDTVYISESDTNYHLEDGDNEWNGINTDNRVYFGWGRTWNVGLKFYF